jgi:Ternary complex associated domain 9
MAARLDSTLAVELGAELTARLESWAEDKQVTLAHVRRLEGGFTGSKVSVVTINPELGHPSRAVLKVTPSDSWFQSEPTNHKLACDAASESLRSRIVGLAYSPLDCNGHKVMFQELAADGADVCSLASLEVTDTFVMTIAAVAAEIARGFSSNIVTRSHSVAGYVSERLEPYRLEAGGRLEMADPDPASASTQLAFGDLRLPRPLAFLRDPQLFTTATIEALVAPTHGDLHPGNILVPIASANQILDSFQLIDFADFSDGRIFMHDCATLALSLLESTVDELGEQAVFELFVAKALGTQVPFHKSTVANLPENFKLEVLRAFASTLHGFHDELDRQFSVCLVTAALLSSCRTVFSPQRRRFWYNMASLFLNEVVSPKSCDVIPVPLWGTPTSEAVLEIARQLKRRENTRSRRSQILILADQPLQTEIADVSLHLFFDAVVDLGPSAADEGRYARKRMDANYRAFSPSTTFGGMAVQWVSLPDGGEPIKDWNRRVRSTLSSFIDKVGATFIGGPLVILDAATGNKGYSIVMSMINELSTEVDVLVVGEVVPEYINDIATLTARVGIDELLGHLLAESDSSSDQARYVPGRDSPVEIDDRSYAWYSECLEILDSFSGLRQTPSDFLRGGSASWFDLAAGLDRWDPPVARELGRSVRDALESGERRKFVLDHFPGAGGSTSLRRLAWDVHRSFPTLMITRVFDHDAALDRILDLSEHVDLPLLAVFDGPPMEDVDRLFRDCAARLRPVVFVVATRQSRRRGVERSRHQSDRFYVDVVRDEKARAKLVGCLEPALDFPESAYNLLTTGDGLTPFLVCLAGNEAAFTGLPDYVRRCIESIDSSLLEAIAFASLLHHFGGVAASGWVLAPEDADSSAITSWTAQLLDSSEGLLVEDPPGSGFVRAIHSSVALEFLVQFLELRHDSWKAALADLSCDFIAQCAAIDSFGVQRDVQEALEHLFVLRESVEPWEERARFSSLINHLPTDQARVRVFDDLVSCFPGNPHFWSHRGRAYDRFLGDFKGATESISHAVELAPNDGLHYHMRALVWRSYFNFLRRSREASNQDALDAANLAREDLEQAFRFTSNKEYPLVASISLSVDVIDYLRSRAGTSTYSEVLRTPLRDLALEWLHYAEVSRRELDIETVVSGPSPVARRTTLRLSALYDDNSLLLQNLDSLLTRNDVPRSLARSLIVSTLVNRAGGHEKLGKQEANRSLRLLEATLDEEPGNVFTLKNWLRIGRSAQASLLRAADLVAGWADASGSREALFYDYVLSFVQLENGATALQESVRAKIQRCREASASYQFRAFRFEWLGIGTELDALVSHHIARPVKGLLDEHALGLRPVLGTVLRVTSAQAATMRLDCGIEAHFVPSQFGFARGRDEEVRIRASIGFSYDGLKCWSVSRLE